MFQFFVDLLSSAYIELAILILLLIYFIMHLRDPRMKVSAVRMVRMAIVIAAFIYFVFIWASTVQPTLRSISIFGMFIINIVMCYYLILSRFEGPYRDALLAISTHPDHHETLHNIWRTGKRFYYARYTVSSLFSGSNPFEFLHGIAIERVRDDIKDLLRRYGLEQKLITFNMMIAFMKNQLACDDHLPEEFKNLMQESLECFTKHPWIEEQVNKFLVVATETPEDLHFPEWMEAFEHCVNRQK
ncbi:MAG: hypothetical protein P8168_04065 [Deltaproteobacteria bacterium]